MFELEDKILCASRIMVNILAESLLHEKVHGLSVPQFRILDMISQGADKPAEIASMLDVTPSALTWTLEKLENMGLLVRGNSKSDRRRVVLMLTDPGVDVVHRVNAHRRDLLGRVLRGMDSSEVSRLESALGSFSDSYMSLKAGPSAEKDA